MAILALDQGTSGSKALVVDDEGIHAVAEIPLHPHYLPGGGVEQDPHELLDSLFNAGKEAVVKAGKKIDGVALANQGETILAWDPTTGEPLTTCIVWQDRRAESVVERLREHSDFIHERTALVLDSYFTAPKMTWLRENLTCEGVVTTTDTWIAYKLTGEFVTDTSTASRSLLLDIDSVTWNKELLNIFNLENEELPRIVASDEIIGMTKEFGDEIPVGGLIVDQQAALFAESCLNRGEGKCTYGTGAFILMNVGEKAPRFSNGLTTSVAWTLRGRTQYCADGQVYTAASAVRWMRDMDIIPAPEAMDKLAAPSSGGVICGPSFAGLAAPWWRPEAGAFLTGMKLATNKPQIIRSILEGIAAQIAHLSRMMCEEMKISRERLRVDGGLTKCHTLMQIQSDLLQVRVETYPSAHATALGAAAAMRLALNSELSVEEGPFPWHAAACYEPAISDDEAQKFLERWLAAVEANMEF